MGKEHRTHGFITLISATVFSFLATLFIAQPIFANINSPQGALDIAGILPGKYAFVDRAKKAPEPVNTPELKPDTNKKEEDDNEEPQVSSVGELIDLMKQATEVAAMLPKEAPKSTATTAPTQLAGVPGLGETLRVVSIVPKKKAIDPLQMIKQRKFQWPVDGFIYSAFQATRGKRIHGAIDIVAAKGTPIAAAADGVVSVVANGGKNFSGYGRIVILDHGKGVHTVYAHCDTTPVKMGQQIKKGQVIATVGRTGRATANLLHFEVRVAGKKIDPLTCMEERPGVVKMVNYRSGKK